MFLRHNWRIIVSTRLSSFFVPCCIDMLSFTRLQFVLSLILAMGLTVSRVHAAEPYKSHPNILFIAVDDLNDWIGCLGGHPLVKTPNIDALAQSGTLFRNAHCQAPLCNPSRTSVLLGLRSTTTGIYGLAPSFRTLPEWKDRVTLPQHFAQNGYRTCTAGKIFHSIRPEDKNKEFAVYGPPSGIGVKPAHKLIPPTPMGNHPLMDWGVFPHNDREKGDATLTRWGVDQLKEMPRDKPFFLSLGYFLPHVPCYTTQQWYDLYPDDDSVLPRVNPHDRDDVPHFAWYLHWSLPEPRLRWLQEQNQWRNLARSYLACISFIDHEVGQLIQALHESKLTEKTIIVLWSDHGWHLGEKQITGKNTLWERSTRVPLIFSGPGIPQKAHSDEPVELLDLFPTLIDLSGLAPRSDLEGHSLQPLLKDATSARAWPAITSHNQGNHAVRSKHWRYIHYADGSEELYDHRTDPDEWQNLAAVKDHEAILIEHRRWLPKIDRPLAAGSSQRTLTYDPATRTAVWEGKTIPPNARIPE